MGFDRLVAMASEVDKRRKSAENSPQQAGQHGSPRKTGASDLRLTDASFDPNSLAAKFKAGLMQGQGGPSQVNKDLATEYHSLKQEQRDLFIAFDLRTKQLPHSHLNLQYI